MAERLGINLAKNEERALPQGMRRVMVGCGWDAQQGRGHRYDLDVACALLDSEETLRSAAEFVYYGNLRYAPSGDTQRAVVHTGDNLTGEGEGDDERLLIDLDRIPEWVHSIRVLCCIFDAKGRGQTFGEVSNCYLRIVDVTEQANITTAGPLYDSRSYAGREFLRFEVNNEAPLADGVIFGHLRRDPRGVWFFAAVQKEVFGGFKSVLETVAGNGGGGGGGGALVSATVRRRANEMNDALSQALTVGVANNALMRKVRENKVPLFALLALGVFASAGIMPMLLIAAIYLLVK